MDEENYFATRSTEYLNQFSRLNMSIRYQFVFSIFLASNTDTDSNSFPVISSSINVSIITKSETIGKSLLERSNWILCSHFSISLYFLLRSFFVHSSWKQKTENELLWNVICHEDHFSSSICGLGFSFSSVFFLISFTFWSVSLSYFMTYEQ